jgi:hyperosmotically inducible protein
MNTSIKALSLATFLIAGLGAAALSSGCAGSATQASTGELIDDGATTAKVKAALVKDPVVKALEVKVETFKGVVQLSGFVTTEAEKLQAGRVAASVNGVSSVKNDIVVK